MNDLERALSQCIEIPRTSVDTMGRMFKPDWLLRIWGDVESTGEFATRNEALEVQNAVRIIGNSLRNHLRVTRRLVSGSHVGELQSVVDAMQFLETVCEKWEGIEGLGVTSPSQFIMDVHAMIEPIVSMVLLEKGVISCALAYDLCGL